MRITSYLPKIKKSGHPKILQPKKPFHWPQFLRNTNQYGKTRCEASWSLPSEPQWTIHDSMRFSWQHQYIKSNFSQQKICQNLTPLFFVQQKKPVLVEKTMFSRVPRLVRAQRGNHRYFAARTLWRWGNTEAEVPEAWLQDRAVVSW